MTSLSHETPVALGREHQSWSERILVPEMWACLAIIVMWLAVLFDAIFGPGLTITNAETVQHVTVPSTTVLAPCAFLGTWVVAKHGFARRRKTE
jgi:hypothetical protein